MSKCDMCHALSLSPKSQSPLHFRLQTTYTSNFYFSLSSEDAWEENMPQKVVTTPYPLIDSDPHAFRVVRYFRPSDYAAVAAGTAAFPAALYFWGM